MRALVKMGMDITGDGQPDLVISEWLGGANCCLMFHIFEIGPTFRKLGTIDAEFGDSGPHFLHPDKDSKTSGAGDSDSRLELCQLAHRFRRLARAKSHAALQRQRVSHRARPDARAGAQCRRPRSARRRCRELCAERQGRCVASRRSLAAAMGNDARSDLQRPRRTMPGSFSTPRGRRKSAARMSSRATSARNSPRVPTGPRSRR